MPSVAEGLTTEGAEAPDPFSAALASKGVIGAAEGGQSGRPSIADGLVFAPAPNSSPAAEEEAATEPEGEAATEEATEGTPLHDDPDIAAYLARFGGDTEKALAAAVEAQKMIGRQGNDLGKAQQELAELRGRVDALTQIATQQPAPQAIHLDAEMIDQGILEVGGLQYATRVANEAPAYLDAVLARWGEDEPYNAATFRMEYDQWKRDQEAAAKAPADDPTKQYVEGQLANERMEQTLATVASEPAFAEGFDGYKEYLMKALEEAEPFVQVGVTSDDPEIQKQAVRVVFKAAQVLAQSDPLKAAANAEAATKAQKAKLAATVVTSQGHTDPAKPAANSDTSEQAEEIARFKSMILGAPSTSVKDGLTFGKA